MPWNNLGIYFVKDDWTLTPPVTAELFRIKHLKIYQSEKYYLKGVIAQAFKDSSGVNTFGDKRFSYRPEPEIFEFYFPVGLGQHSLAFKRLDDSNIFWRIQVESFFTEDAELDYLNYLQARFGNINIEEIIMALYSRGTAETQFDLSPDFKKTKLKSNTPKKLVEANPDRKQLTVRTGLHGITLATGFNDDGEPMQVLETIPANHNFDLPSTSNAIYQGEIWAISYANCLVEFTEYSLLTEADKKRKKPPMNEQPVDEQPVEGQPVDDEIEADESADS